MKRALVSILNWNSSARTVQCLHSLQNLDLGDDLEIYIRIIDNNSTIEQKKLLGEINCAWCEVVYSETNTGFTGGQNINIQYAVDHGFDFVWLLNNDTLVPQNALIEIVALMESDSLCGAVSPLIVRLGDPSIIDFCGSVFDWDQITSHRPNGKIDPEKFIAENLEKITAVGTALLLRVSAVRDVGNLDDHFFAYYEDDDYGARLIHHGWRTRIATSTYVEHACFEGDMYQRPPYFFYLMVRNAIFFALKHTPAPQRRFLRLRFIDRSLFMAEKLFERAQPEKARACLLGLADGLAGRGGTPVLNRRIPGWVRILQPISRLWNKARRTQ